MRKLFLILGVVIASTFAFGSTAATAAPPAPRNFVVTMNANDEVPRCAAGSITDRGVAIFHVTDQSAGTVRYLIVSTDLPGQIILAHIHKAPKGVAAPPAQPLDLTGAQFGVVVAGTFSNPALVADMQAHPDQYYVNVHTDVCQPGVIRGQFGDHGFFGF